MQPNVFKAGVEPGSPSNSLEVKVLICYLLSKIEKQVSFTQLYEALSQPALVNYFEMTAALDELVKNQHITSERLDDTKAEQYSISPKGKQITAELEHSLPLSVREKSVDSLKNVLDRDQRASEVSINIKPVDTGGFIMNLSIPDGSAELISFSLFVPDIEQCDIIKRRFLNAPLLIYRGVISLLKGNREVFDNLFQPEKPLF